MYFPFRNPNDLYIFWPEKNGKQEIDVFPSSIFKYECSEYFFENHDFCMKTDKGIRWYIAYYAKIINGSQVTIDYGHEDVENNKEEVDLGRFEIDFVDATRQRIKSIKYFRSKEDENKNRIITDLTTSWDK